MGASLLLVSAAAAWTLTGSWWTWQDHPIEDPFAIDAASFPAAAGDTGEIHAAVSTAMGTWNDVGLDVTLLDGGATTGHTLDVDGDFGVFHGTYAGLGAALAFAATWSDEDGAGLDCDVMFLDANDYGAVTWSADWTGGTYDIQAVALHELGHCLGLDHSADATAVMYAYYGGLHALTADDTAGLAALYDASPCVDADGDGFTDCDGDCDEQSALVHPGAAEVCDGVDGDCDGVVDQATPLAVSFGDGPRTAAGDWGTGGNAFTVTEATALTGVTQAIEVDAGARLVWAVLASDDGGATWTTLRTERGEGVAGGVQASPALHEALVPGRLYAVVAGAMGAATFSWDASPALAAQGPVLPAGGVVGRIEALDATTPDAAYLWNQAITVSDLADPDGDGVTELCGDCAPDDATQFPGNPEACDGLDQDCDDEVDEDFATDTDSDGVIDCLDPCPEDAQDACDDPVDTADTDPPGDSADTGDVGRTGDDTTAGEKPAGCACDAGGSALAGWALLLAAAMARRRR